MNKAVEFTYAANKPESLYFYLVLNWLEGIAEGMAGISSTWVW